MNHFIAMNPQRGGSKGSASCLPLTEYDKLIAQPWLHDMVEQIRGGNDKLKGLLPSRCAHYGRFFKNHRSQKDADPTSFLFQTTIDIDDHELVDIAIEMARQLNCSDGIWKGMLLHLEYSARKKLHIDIRMPMGMTIEETQRAYCDALGVPCDESCFSPERIIYITDKDSEIYRSKHWYEVLPAQEIQARREAYLKRGLTIDGRGKDAQPITQEISASSAKSACVNHICEPASEKALIAFDLFQESAGLKNVAIDTQGSRHSSLLAIMSAGATRVMTEEELKRVVAAKMPSFSMEHDCQQLIHDFYVKYGDNSKPFSRDVIRVNAEAERQAAQQQDSSILSTVDSPAAGEPDDYPDPPEMPRKLPKLVELLISNTPELYQPAVAHAIFPPLATHMWRTRFNYIDNVEHEPTLMCCLLAGTGAGKNCVQMPINLIMEDIRKRDQENLQREKEWKDEVTRKGANKDKRKRPQSLIIQEIDADMTNPAFVMRMSEAQEHFLYTSLNEIDQFDALKGTGGQQFRIMCLAFDPGNQYGQTRVGTQSVTERVTVRFNWNASTTIEKGQRYFQQVLTDGPLSRINFCTIPEREIGDDMPIYGIYDDAFREQLKPYIENLCAASGRIDCPEAFQLAIKLKDENADFSRMSQDRVYENFSFRANVIAYLKACVLYVANGCKWEPEIEEFIRWSEQYDLYCKMRYFGDLIVRKSETGEKSSKRGPSNLLQLLPNVFSYQQIENLRVQYGKSKKGTKQMLSNWLFRKYIKRVEMKQGETVGIDGNFSNFTNFSFEKLMFRQEINK